MRLTQHPAAVGRTDIDPIVPILIFAILIAIVLAWLISAAGSRLDRLHKKVEAARVVLDSQLVRRASLTAGLAMSDYLDPVTSVLLADAAWNALESQGAAQEHIGALPTNPATDEVDAFVTTVSEMVPGRGHDREMKESELSHSLRIAFDDPASLDHVRENSEEMNLMTSLAQTCYRVELARLFYNDAVSQAVRVRKKWIVRLLHLAGHAELPAMFDMDDAAPAVFTKLRMSEN